jgi:signal transduction histidine kinase
LHRQEHEAIISVQDEGQGIPAEEQDQLFKVFGRTSVQSTQGEKSTGLGLAISRRIVEEHGGRIWVESEEGEGATFYVALPIES